MIEVKAPRKAVANWELVRDEWTRAVTQLVADVETWSKAREWPTRRIEKRIDDPQIGEYVVPALLIQVDLVKLLLEPVARFVPGAAGLVDLYRLPEYDDVASVFRRDGGWQVHYTVTGENVPAQMRAADPSLLAAQITQPFTADEFAKLVQMMV